MGLEDLFSAALSGKKAAEKTPGEAPLSPKHLNALISSIEEYRKTMPVDKASDLAGTFGSWSEGISDPHSKGEYIAAAKEYFKVELAQEAAANERRAA